MIIKPVLDHIKDSELIRWNKDGSLVYEGQSIPGSHITDLVNDILRERKTTHPPTGWEEFTTALKKANVPRELIGNSKRWSAELQKTSFLQTTLF